MRNRSVKLLIKYLSRFLSIYELCFWMSQSFRSWVSDEVVSILFGSTWHADVFTLAPIQGGLPAILPEYPEIRIDTAYLGGSHPNTLPRKSTEAVLPRQRLRSTEGSGAQDLFDAQAAAWALRSPATVARWPKDWLRMATAIKLFFICVWCCLCDNTYVDFFKNWGCLMDFPTLKPSIGGWLLGFPLWRPRANTLFGLAGPPFEQPGFQLEPAI